MVPQGIEPPNTSGPVPRGTPAPLDLSGRTFADFHVLRKLGQGGMGQVYLAEQVSLRRKVALKILRPEMAVSPRALERFKLEAESVARATHANIVQVYAYGEAEGMPYMALEYVEGRNLKDHVSKKGPPDLLVALSIMRQVASALQRASELGIIHRDIKPENILLTRKVEVKVADFGLSRWLESERPALDLTQTGVTMGTPLYMSPEQVEGKPVDSRTDIYSFGVTCYHMLTGQPPFTGSTPFQVALAHVQKEPVPLSKLRPDLPDALCAVVHKMMAKDPAGRYQTGRDLLRDLSRLREGLSGNTTIVQPAASLEAPPPVPTTVPTGEATAETVPVTGRRRRTSLVVAFIGSLLLGTATGAGLAWRERRREGPLPGPEPVAAADASAVEAILLPQRREQALRVLVDRVLATPPGKALDAAGFTNCMDLGLFYLDNNRLDDAGTLFARLDGFREPASLRMLGQVGRAIVLALKNQEKESNRLLCAVFAPEPNLLGPLLPRKKEGKGMGPAFQLARKLEQHLAPIKPFLDHPRGRYWLARACWYNAQNGVDRRAVPRYLLWRFPPMTAAAVERVQ